MYKDILNQVPPDYYDSGIKSNLFQWIWHSWKWHSLKSFIIGFKGQVLDVGCADGNLTAKIQDLLPEANLTGVDLYSRSISYARKNRPDIRFKVADARKLPFASNSFDAIICIETLEHIPTNKGAINEIYRVLKKNGKFVVCQDTDSLIFNFVWFFWTKWKGRVWSGAHVSCMKPSEIEILLKRRRFKIIKKSFSHLGQEVIFLSQK